MDMRSSLPRTLEIIQSDSPAPTASDISVGTSLNNQAAIHSSSHHNHSHHNNNKNINVNGYQNLNNHNHSHDHNHHLINNVNNSHDHNHDHHDHSLTQNHHTIGEQATADIHSVPSSPWMLGSTDAIASAKATYTASSITNSLHNMQQHYPYGSSLPQLLQHHQHNSYQQQQQHPHAAMQPPEALNMMQHPQQYNHPHPQYFDGGARSLPHNHDQLPQHPTPPQVLRAMSLGPHHAQHHQLLCPKHAQQQHAAPPHLLDSGGGAAIGYAGEATGETADTSGAAGMDNLATNNIAVLSATLNSQKSLYQEKIFHQPSESVEAVLAAGCEVMGFDIAEVWLRTGPKTHQLTNSHLRPTALQETLRKELVDVYYGDKSSERTHRLSPALCKRAKEQNDVVWVTAHTPHGAEALRCSISNVRTAVAIPVCQEASNTNLTIIFFSIRRILMRPTSVEFLIHMSLAAAVAAVNTLAEDGLLDRPQPVSSVEDSSGRHHHHNHQHVNYHSEHVPHRGRLATGTSDVAQQPTAVASSLRHQRVERFSITGAQLDLQWRQLHNVEYLTDGGNSWIHTAVYNGKPVVVKTLKPECQDVAVAINEIESELAIHSRLNHPNIVSLIGAGTTSKGIRFVVLERLDGGTLTQMLGYDTRIRDRRRRFWRKKQMSYLDVLQCCRAIAEAMAYCHEDAIPGSMVLHRDLKPDNIGFSLQGGVKILDFGLARLVENASVNSNDVYKMSGETGSLRYMAPEVADALPYNHKADVYSYGIILWELNAGKKPFDGLNREMFYERVVHGGERPPLNKKWPEELRKLMTDCWSAEMENRPTFRAIVEKIDGLLENEKSGGVVKKKVSNTVRRISGIIDRHSTWF